MTQKDVYDLLSSFGIPVGFNRIKKGTSLPFITYHISQPNNFVADSVVYYEILNVEFRVYEGEQINPQLHETIREKLKDNWYFYYDDYDGKVNIDKIRKD